MAAVGTAGDKDVEIDSCVQKGTARATATKGPKQTKLPKLRL